MSEQKMSDETVVYNLMDWAEIEALVYSEHDNPHHLLGPHITEEGILVEAFFPNVESVSILLGEDIYPMILEDEAGFYAAMLPGKKIPDYMFEVHVNYETIQKFHDPYSFDPIITKEELRRFNEGKNYEVYEILGAHQRTVKGVQGILFAVWAPFAMRVSVVGDFNNWDGRRNPMRRLGDSGVFELFIPELPLGTIYKFELKAQGGLTYLKADPYANAAELRPNTASIVTDLDRFSWSDKKWMEQRKLQNYDKKPVYIYEVHLGSWKKPKEENGSFYNYRELAVLLAEYVKEIGYTHIELMPVMEHPLDASWGYQVTGYYAATKRYGTPEDFMYFIDYMHKQGIGVILDWVPAHFPRDTFGLAAFDGTCLYEHMDPRQGAHPHWGTLIYNYARPEVANFLIANALFWVEKYHVDGIRMDAVASMLYLDYGKNDGEWVANKNGGNENLEAIEFLRHLSTVFHKRKDGALLIAEESTAWPEVTGDIKKDGLGFDLKWNMGWMNDFTNYMKQDPFFRKGCHGSLTFSMMYAYSEKFILVLSHDEVVHGKCSMLNKMPGTIEEKFANLRAAYGFMVGHPGKKLLFMGQDFAQEREWSEERSLDWGLIDQDKHSQMKQYMKDLIKLYRKYPALYELDFDPKGFEWMSCLDADHSIVSFVRKTRKKEETLFVICNFTPVVYENTAVGVPFAGKYKEIFNSDNEQYGGQNNVNPRAKISKKVLVDGQKNSISITIPPLGIAVFTCTPETKSTKEAGKKQNEEIKVITQKEAESIKNTEETKKVKKKEVKEEAVVEETIKLQEKMPEPAAKRKKTAKKAEEKKIEEEKIEEAESAIEEKKEPAKEIAAEQTETITKEQAEEETIVAKKEPIETKKELTETKPAAKKTTAGKETEPAIEEKKAVETKSRKRTAKKQTEKEGIEESVQEKITDEIETKSNKSGKDNKKETKTSQITEVKTDKKGENLEESAKKTSKGTKKSKKGNTAETLNQETETSPVVEEKKEEKEKKSEKVKKAKLAEKETEDKGKIKKDKIKEPKQEKNKANTTKDTEKKTKKVKKDTVKI